MSQVIFNSKKSLTDLDIQLESFSIQPPSKKKIKVPVPFMNSSYDFSTVGSSGEIVYTDRIIKTRFNLRRKNRGTLYNKYSEVLAWLLDVGQRQLIFTDMPDCYYLAEVENAPSFEEIAKRAGIMEIEFIAVPFKYGVSVEGSEQLWDTFNFETGYLQETMFEVLGTKSVTIYNPGREVVPIINCNSNMICLINSYSVGFVAGDNKDYNFKLANGANTVVITGIGTIKFIFRKELL
jgi:predicted phage tail component-like protein